MKISRPDKFPLTVIVKPTKRCNLSCKYCDKEEFGEPDDETYDYKVPCKINYDL